ncbi:MAG: sensor histidine kinase [Solirubrobacteraceae bacterium]
MTSAGVPHRVGRLAVSLRHPQTTVRWRLTLLYGALFLVSGAVLLAVTYTLVSNATVTGARFVGPPAFARFARSGPVPAQILSTPTVGNRRVTIPPGLAARVKKLLGSQVGRVVVAIGGSTQRIADLHHLVIESVIALALMAVISGGLGWVVAGRVLRPLRTMTAATRQISEASLDRRLAMPGPPDELRRLADTIDGLLERLQTAFDAQRRFVANASHELRTPLTVTRALLEMTISDPDATVETFRQTGREVLEEGERQEQLIDALLSLAQGQRGIDHWETVDLAAIAGDVLAGLERGAAARGLTLDVSLGGAPVSGDCRLIERLASNLIDNAIRHNIRGGLVRVSVDARTGSAVLAVSNTGQPVPEEEVERLLQPFQRLTAGREAGRGGDGTGGGLGLGLSIVAAIADAHGASLEVHPGARGGLEVSVRFPPVSDRDPAAGSADTSSERLQPV